MKTEIELKKIVNRLLEIQETQRGYRRPLELKDWLLRIRWGGAVNWNNTEEEAHYWITLIHGEDRDNIITCLIHAPSRGYEISEQTETFIVDNETFVL